MPLKVGGDGVRMVDGAGEQEEMVEGAGLAESLIDKFIGSSWLVTLLVSSAAFAEVTAAAVRWLIGGERRTGREPNCL